MYESKGSILGCSFLNSSRNCLSVFVLVIPLFFWDPLIALQCGHDFPDVNEYAAGYQTLPHFLHLTSIRSTARVYCPMTSISGLIVDNSFTKSSCVFAIISQPLFRDTMCFLCAEKQFGALLWLLYRLTDKKSTYYRWLFRRKQPFLAIRVYRPKQGERLRKKQ